MVDIVVSSSFKKAVKHLDQEQREKVEKLISQVIANPQKGKPLKYLRGERVLRVKPYRLVYSFRKSENTLYLLKLEHRKSVYD